MRALAGSTLYTFSIRNYGETACSKKEKFLIIPIIILILAQMGRFPRGESELIAFLYKDASGREYIIPVCVSAEARNGLNINRDQQYRIEFQVKDVNPKVRGVCVATSIQPK